jgi:hypothetical protein
MDKKYIELAIKNITRYGDTDIFPFPIENNVFFDNQEKTVKHFLKFDSSYSENIDKSPPVNISTCSPIGYTGFRWATQIDPEWNAYFLALVLSVAEESEKQRVKTEQKVIHSYRFKPDYETGQLFDIDINWRSFHLESLEIAKSDKYEYVVTCDIADFYSRIYHHRLENALLRLNFNNDTPKRIMGILQKFSGTNSYGLPIGGPAARILAELALNNLDKILKLNGIRFTRFVDDIHLFASSKEEAHQFLNFLSIKLMNNEGLTLQKHKTQILTKSEFIKLVSSRIHADSEDGKTQYRTKFMALPVRYDPYSPTADEDYKEIKKELESFDILGLLNEELRKSRIHQQFSKHLLKSLSVLDSEIVSEAFIAIVQRLDLLYPIFPNLMMAATHNFDKLNPRAQERLLDALQELVKTDSYIIQIELNAAYMVRLLGKKQTTENEETLSFLNKKFQDSMLVRSWILQVFSNWKMDFWLSDLRSNFPTMTKWERRIFIVASYFMKDEGSHWRNHNKKGFSDFEILIRDWAADRIQIKDWNIPL